MRRASFIDQLEYVNGVAWTMYNANPLHVKKINMSPTDIARLFNALAQNKVKYILANLTNYKGKMIDPGKFTDIDPEGYGV